MDYTQAVTNAGEITFSLGWIEKHPAEFASRLTEFLQLFRAKDYDITIDHSCCWKIEVNASLKSVAL